MNTPNTQAVTDAEVGTALRIVLRPAGGFSESESAAMRRALEQFAQSRAQDAPVAVGAPKGYAIVPIEPTPKMRAAGAVSLAMWQGASPAVAVWHEMLAATPATEQAAPDAELAELREAIRMTPDHAQLAKFYGVTTYAALAQQQAYHIEKLQAKLSATPSLAPNRVREG